MSDEKPAGQQLEAGVDPPEAGRDRERDSSPSFSHVVNAVTDDEVEYEMIRVLAGSHLFPDALDRYLLKVAKR